MFDIGDWVVYGIHGVCKIIGVEKQMVDHRRKPFFVLQPLASKESRFFLPKDNPTALAKLRTVLNQQQLQDILTSKEVEDDNWIEDENHRRQYYKDLITHGDRIDILKMVASLHRYKDSLAESGRKFHLCDDNFLRDAEKLISSEVALVMDLPMEEAKQYLHQQLHVS